MRPRLAAACLLASALASAGCGRSGTGGPGVAGPVTTPSPPPSVDPVPLAAPPRPRSGETLGARLHGRTALRSAPSALARVLARQEPRTRFGSRTVLAVVRQRPGWLGVLSPLLGNRRVGWIRLGDAELLRETWSIRVDLSRRRATLRHQGRRYWSFPVAVGAPGTETPTGTFGVTDRLRTGGPGSGYGCCVLALSGHQPDVPQDWPGGDRIAIHGTSAPRTVGTAASHGCLRAGDEAMRILMRRIPLGTQVVIRD